MLSSFILHNHNCKDVTVIFCNHWRCIKS